MHRTEDASPWELRAGGRQEASDYTPEPVGGASAWYVGRRYVADASTAALARQRDAERETRDAARFAAYLRGGRA